MIKLLPNNDHGPRMKLLIEQMQLILISFDLCTLSEKHHLRIQTIIADTLEHNQKNFLMPKVHRINNLLNKLEYHG